jgi:uncharacterized protein YeaO (DUF488 family)
MTVQIKRVYETAGPDDGYRVLVDRLWPRGISKEKAKVDGWEREVAPSDALRKWFGHDPSRWDELRERYRRELEEPERKRILETLKEKARSGRLTLVYGAKDEVHNQAAVLMEIIGERT